MDVLKDGGAVVIYGTRGSWSNYYNNKNRDERFDSVSYNGYISLENMDRSLPVMSRSEYLEYGGTDYGVL